MNNHSEFVEYNQTVENMQSIQTKTLFEQAGIKHEKFSNTLNNFFDLDWKDVIKEQERIPFEYEQGELIRFFFLKY